ncbi:ABC transporter ATP-binding protein, partial [Desulfobulbus elongatus]|uniref:ABC transporter ATP-binding protein n=1 Tax=Desulfobulbus elongatus TaxID=53332 RepID=UPI00054ED4B0
MSSIVVTDLGKAYKQYPTRWARLAEWIVPWSKPRHQLKWVLQDINFTVNPGEAVGIIGINGAGKSTLLKMITGTTQPTTGSVHITGRVSALLELGMGFHPDFTGRQNVVMAGQLLGYSIEEIARLMPEIEAFAEIGDYIDEPVRVYSSGMQMRLAFSVATAQRPDVLIVDEALSVGDAAFQRKCFHRIENFREAGTTLLFVSHDTSTIKKICTRGLFLKEGLLWSQGDSKQVCDQYEKYLFGTIREEVGNVGSDYVESPKGFWDDSLCSNVAEEVYGDGGALIKDVSVKTTNGYTVNVIKNDESFSLIYEVQFKKDVSKVCFGMTLRTVEGINLYGTNTNFNGGTDFRKGDVVKVTFNLKNNLMPGNYFISCGASHQELKGRIFLHRRVDCIILRVIEAEHMGETNGLVNLEAKHTVSVKKDQVGVA